MSAPSESTEDAVDTEDVGSLGDVLPASLQPLWRPVERIQEFRRDHGDTYVNAVEAIIAVVLVGGYLWWAYLFFMA